EHDGDPAGHREAGLEVHVTVQALVRDDDERVGAGDRFDVVRRELRGRELDGAPVLVRAGAQHLPAELAEDVDEPLEEAAPLGPEPPVRGEVVRDGHGQEGRFHEGALSPAPTAVVSAFFSIPVTSSTRNPAAKPATASHAAKSSVELLVLSVCSEKR